MLAKLTETLHKPNSPWMVRLNTTAVLEYISFFVIKIVLFFSNIFYFPLFLLKEAEFNFTKELGDTDTYEKEEAMFECHVNDPDATVTWFREDQVCDTLGN